MTLVRPASVSGMFYPAELGALRNQLHGFYRKSLGDESFDGSDIADDTIAEMSHHASTNNGAMPKIIVGPHAGYVYSGDCCARAYAELYPYRDNIKKIVILGPSHRMFVDGIALPSSEIWQTPLGGVMVDHHMINRLKKSGLNIVKQDDVPHALEHSLEVHVPFMQTIFKRFTILPIVVGKANINELTKLLEIVWGGDETLIVISSDLSHYHPYDECNKIDSETAQIVEDMAWQSLTGDRACGFVPLAASLKCGKDNNMKINRIHLCNSGDTAGDKSRVVGYGAWKLYNA